MSQEVRSQWVYTGFCLLLVISRMTFMWQPKRFWVFFFYIAWECVSLMVADHWGHPSTMGEQTVQSSTQVQNNACSSYPASIISKGSEAEEQSMTSSPPSSAVACWDRACLTVLISLPALFHKDFDCQHRCLKDTTTTPSPHFK